jgi:peptidoglycan hydrolase-like protein with peptidoglycan-binding domain
MSKNIWVEQPCPEQKKRTYFYSNGAYLVKDGGTVSWRNNNEGNLRPGSLSASRIGVDKMKFAIFATPEDGHEAKRNLLFSSSYYKNLTLSDAIKRYAPATDNNDPKRYFNFITSHGSVGNTAMHKYTTDEQHRIMSAMKIQEGYRVGTESSGKSGNTSTKNSINKKHAQSVKNNKSNNSNLNYNVKSAVRFNKNLPYSVPTWKSIQTKLNNYSSKSSLIQDGIPGKLTANAIYGFQSMRGMTLRDGKLGDNTFKLLGLKKTDDNKSGNNTNKPNTSSGKVTIPSGSVIMSSSYTPKLDILSKHATQNGYNVKDIATSANYTAKYCTGSSSQHQCTRGTSLYLQLASYARGEADSTYKSSCAAHLFGSVNALTNYNISASVAGEFLKTKASNKTGKDNMNSYIINNLKKDGEFVTFKYSTSQHIVFHSGGKWYSDFKQGTAAGCGNSKTLYSNVHFYTL